MLQEIKPCPFCGGKAELKFVSEDEPVTNFAMYYKIGCDSCNVHFCYTVRRLPGFDNEEHEKAKGRLVDKWNNRA